MHTPLAPTDPHEHLILDADTTHHCLLPGVFGLEKMGLQTRRSVPLHKEVRASRTLTKVLGGVHCAPSPTISEGYVGSGGL